MTSIFQSVPVLCYHKVSDKSDIDTKQFRSQMQMLKSNGYTTITAMELFHFLLGEMKLPSKPVVLTFDDCHLDNWVNVIPILKEYDFKAVFFCITGFLHDTPKRPQGENNPNVEILGMSDSYIAAVRDKNFSQFMSREEIYETVHTFGHEVYSHSETHAAIFRSTKLKGVYPDKSHWSLYQIYNNVENGTKLYERGSCLAYNGYEVAEDHMEIRHMDERAKYCRVEMEKSKKELEFLLSKPCHFFCWPFGEYDKLSMRMLEETGYLGSFTLERGSNAVYNSPYKINRIEIKGKTTLSKLSRQLKVYSNSLLANLCSKKFKLKAN